MATTLIEQAIKLELLSDAATIALIGDRVALNKAPQDWFATTVAARPYIVIFKVAAPRNYAFDNISTLVQGTFQLSIWSSVYTVTIQVSDVVRKLLANQTATTTFGGAGGFEIGAIYLEDESDLLDREIQPERHNRAQTYRIAYYESRT